MPANEPTALAKPPRNLELGQATICLAKGAASLVKMTSGGLVKAVVTNVRLDADEHVYKLKGKRRITAAGFNHANRFAGVTFFQPTTVQGEEGATHRNPHIEYDDAGAAKRVVIRCVGIGRNATGNWTAIDSTLIYDMEAVFAQDALSKWRSKGYGDRPATTKDWGTLYSRENVPEEVRKNALTKCLPIPGGYVLAVKLSGEVLDIVSEHANRVRFASRNAETVVKRNILKKFLGIDAVGEDLTISVTSWPQADRESIQEIGDVVERAETGQFVVDGETVQVEHCADVVDDIEDEDAALAGEHDEEAARDEPEATDEGVAPVTPKPAADPEVAKRRAKIRELYAKLPEDVAEDAIVSAGLEGMAEVARTGDASLLDAAIRALNEEVMRRIQAEKASKKTAGEAKLDLKA